MRGKRSANLGKEGETRSVEFLKNMGYEIIMRNYRCPAGEIDIIARDGRCICFVEVKTRSSKRFGLPQEAVDERKQRKITGAALYFIRESGTGEEDFRFDVVAVSDEIRLFRDAFSIDRKGII